MKKAFVIMQDDPLLKRSLTLPLVTLYGIGVTIGAGIYVLVGLTAAKAGLYAPIAFLVAGAGAIFTGLSYAELATRMPVSAGEAAYVMAGFSSRKLALVVGLLVAASGIISASAVSLGASAYLSYFIPVPVLILTVLVILALGLVALWGVIESVLLAALFTLIEIAGLGFVIYGGFVIEPELLSRSLMIIPPAELPVWTGIYAASLLAFFAFVGFEDIANIAEEVKTPRTTMPLAILLTLGISSVIYFLVVSVVVLSVPMDQLQTSSAPLGLIFRGAGAAESVFYSIATIATMNGILVQMIMASRIFYGLSRQGALPALLGRVHPLTRTPVVATLLVIFSILCLALFFPIDKLASATSLTVLIVFGLVNLALLMIKRREIKPRTDVFRVPSFIPVVGFLLTLFLISASLAG